MSQMCFRHTKEVCIVCIKMEANMMLAKGQLRVNARLKTTKYWTVFRETSLLAKCP